MRVLTIFWLMFLHLSTHAQSDQRWRWYLSSFCSPALEASLCTRVGLAQVLMDSGRVHATLMDPKLPETALTFDGKFLKSKTITGQLQGLSSHAPSQDEYQGAYSTLQMGKNCKAEQILLMPKVPDGSVLSLSRIQGACQ